MKYYNCFTRLKTEEIGYHFRNYFLYFRLKTLYYSYFVSNSARGKKYYRVVQKDRDSQIWLCLQ